MRPDRTLCTSCRLQQRPGARHGCKLVPRSSAACDAYEQSARDRSTNGECIIRDRWEARA